MEPAYPRVFLLSPAHSGGERAKLVLNERAQFALAVQLRTEGATLGEVYAFLSGLYFRGKLAYARAFASPPAGIDAAFVITPGRGLLSPEVRITIDELRAMGGVPIDLEDARYREPLLRDARSLDQAAGPDCRYVLLGSLATPKYVSPLLDVFGERLLFPSQFVGRGDMSRGGLMLRCAHHGEELEYVPAHNAVRHGPRPAKLPKWKPTRP